MDYFIAELGRERQRQLLAEAAEWRRAAAARPRRARLRSTPFAPAASPASAPMRRATPMRRRRAQPEVSCLRAAAAGGLR